MATTEADGEISADYNDADIMFAQGVIVNCALKLGRFKW